MPGPLEGLRVLDLTTRVAGPYATKLLADHGADVIKIEPEGGDPARADAPFFGGEPHPERSLRFLHLNTNKRAVRADVGAAGDDGAGARELVLTLAAEADLIFEDLPPGRMAELGLGYGELEAARPGIILVSITPWGQEGPYVDYRQSDLTVQAMVGPMLWTGSLEREPLKNGGVLAWYQAGAVAALAAMVAYYRQERDGRGDWIDVSIYETQAGSRDRVTPYMTNHSYTGFEPRRAAAGVSLASGVRPCLDGYVHILGTGGAGRLQSYLRMIGRDDLVDDPRLAVAAQLVEPELVEEIEASYLGWLMQRTKAEAVEEAQRFHLLAGAINTPADLASDPHFEGRGAWDEIDHPETGPQRYPGRPFVMSDSPRQPAGRAPLLDEHGADVRDGGTRAWAPRPDRAEPATRGNSEGRGASVGYRGADPGLPLHGVRVIDSTVVWAGPYGTQLLAEWGAEVIRVEPVTRFQPQTRQMERPTSKEEQLRLHESGAGTPGGYSFPDYDPGQRPWERNSGFNSHARNKLSATADISTDEGRDLFYRLIRHADVFVENNVPETIEKAGITYDDLRSINPDLIMLRMPAYGLDGPYKNYRGLGLHVEAMIGHHYIRAYPVGTPDEAGSGLAGDAIAGIQGAFAVTMALRHRLRTGRGQQIELAQAENFLAILGEQILDWTMNGREPGPQGNRHPSRAPHQAYPAAGQDQWIAIDAGSDEDFRACCEVLGAPQLADDPRFADGESRLENIDALDTAIGELTAGHGKFELFERLQRAGVIAGPLQSAAERRACPQLAVRGFYEELENDVCGRHWYPGLIWRMANTPNRLRTAPVTLGQDNEYVWKTIVGMSDEEYAAHERSGQFADTYPPALLSRWPGLAAE